ncbi:MAG: PQQ-binding-like beta-propeller repeat protein [Rhodospirillaceae bacterium]|nr:PQQ-binding-like beta-propeller repeat protein [Rhodospirillaceae bacterium]MBT7033291.1 PQQ-binding-like beta-propeller repeat protein [Rhodospirillaceae bacterium]MBT7569058.1 PQQ-binding-like beta-propeller repeat protein [Rhodospirillaceae bacterium]
MRYLKTGLTHHDPALATPGFTLYTPLDLPKTLLLNMAGEEVHGWDIAGKSTSYTHLLPNGNLLAATKTGDSPTLPQAGGLMRELDWDGNLIWEHDDPGQHHDFRRLANGNTAYLAWTLMPGEYSKRVQGGLPGSEHEDGIWGDVIREVDAAGNLVFEWRGWEHLAIEDYPLGPTSNRHVFAHPNTLFPMEGGDYLICFRHIDLLVIVSRDTGEITWQHHDAELGGPHDAQFLADGNMMIFANRDGLRPHGSAVIEFNHLTGEEVWSYRGNPSHTFDSSFISGCQRLWSGNTLICEGMWGRFFEVTPDGTIVWEYVNPHSFYRDFGVSIGDVNYVFRAYRYAADGPEIQGRLGAP